MTINGLTHEELVTRLGVAGFAAYRNTLVGNAAPRVAAYFERVTHPQPGDLVVETSTFMARHGRGTAHEAVGRLARVEQLQPLDDDPGTRSSELFHVESLVTGQSVAWENCMWVAIPETPGQEREWAS